MEPRQADGRDEDHNDAPASRSAFLRWLAAAALIGLLAGATGYLGWLRFEHHRTEVAAAQALAAAEKYALALTTYDSQAMDQTIGDILDGSTGEFKDRYGKSHEPLRQVLLDHQAAARGHIVESAVKSASPNKAVILLLVDQAVINSDSPDPEIDRSRIKMTMEKVDGRWLASKVELR